jgi:diguanylate cyclase (GGDEF)-like protein
VITARRSLLLRAYVVATAVVASAALAATVAESWLAAAVLLSVVAAIGVAACLLQVPSGDPSARRGRLLVAAGAVVMFVTGVTVTVRDVSGAFGPAVTLLPGLLSYPLLGVGLMLSLSRAGRFRLIDALDAAAAALGAFLVSWVFVFHPYADVASGTWLWAMVGHPIGSLFVFASAVLVVLVSNRPRTRAVLAVLATGCLLASAATITVMVSAGGFNPVRVPEAAWLWAAFLVLLGASALSPGPASTGSERIRATLTFGRATLFGGLALFGPVAWIVVVTRADSDAMAGAAVPVCVGAILSLLLLWRLTLTARIAQRRARQLAQRTKALTAANEEQQRLQQQLRHQATHDGLTGLVNRGVLREVMTRALEGGAYPLSLLLLDLDGFKETNDTRGHVVGDEILALVARRLTAVLPASATVARLGGDEFAALIPDADTDAGVHAASLVNAELRRPYSVGHERVALSASIGILPMGPASPAWTATEALRCADIAMYAAKNAGRDNYVLYTDAE